MNNIERLLNECKEFYNNLMKQSKNAILAEWFQLYVYKSFESYFYDLEENEKEKIDNKLNNITMDYLYWEYIDSEDHNLSTYENTMIFLNYIINKRNEK